MTKLKETAPVNKKTADKKKSFSTVTVTKSASAKPKKPAEIKTKKTSESVSDFLNKIPEEERRNDCMQIVQLMQKASGDEPKMWGSSIIGFGDHRYKSPASGREVDWMKIGFAPRKANITLYLVTDIKQHEQLLNKLGKHKTGGGCLYINKLNDIDIKILKELINVSLSRFKI